MCLTHVLFLISQYKWMCFVNGPLKLRVLLVTEATAHLTVSTDVDPVLSHLILPPASFSKMRRLNSSLPKLSHAAAAWGIGSALDAVPFGPLTVSMAVVPSLMPVRTMHPRLVSSVPSL